MELLHELPSRLGNPCSAPQRPSLALSVLADPRGHQRILAPFESRIRRRPPRLVERIRRSWSRIENTNKLKMRVGRGSKRQLPDRLLFVALELVLSWLLTGVSLSGCRCD